MPTRRAIGLRVQDLLDPKIFRQKLELVLREKNPLLAKVYNRLGADGDAIASLYLDECLPRLEPHIGDAIALVHEALDAEATCSSRSPGHLSRPRPRHVSLPDLLQSGRRWCLHRRGRRAAGHRPRDRIAKAYVTRVGAGPFVTELLGPADGGSAEDGEAGNLLVERGAEFGTNTGGDGGPAGSAR